MKNPSISFFIGYPAHLVKFFLVFGRFGQFNVISACPTRKTQKSHGPSASSDFRPLEDENPNE